MQVSLDKLKDTKQYKTLETSVSSVTIPDNFFITGLDLYEFYVYRIIERFTYKGKYGKFTGSVRTLQIRIGKSYNTVVKILSGLEKKGFIKTVDAGNGHNDYVALKPLNFFCDSAVVKREEEREVERERRRDFDYSEDSRRSHYSDLLEDVDFSFLGGGN